ncbi:MAG: molybdopterin dinucleotide binding domain-containing protein, partial [Acidobacteriota bacterium]
DELREGAVVFGVVARAVMQHGRSLARAGFEGAPLDVSCALFERICAAESGLVFAIDDWSEVMRRAKPPFHLALPDLLDELARLDATPARDAEFPFVLTAGERRSFTANTIMRDPGWRKKDEGGALRVHPDDAAALGVATGGLVRLVTRRAAVTVAIEVSDTMQRGHVALPNGLGLAYPDRGTTGVAPNELTRTEDRDPFVGTPWHKHVPARLERA